MARQGNSGAKVALGQLLGRRLDPADRPRHETCQKPADDRRDQQTHRSHADGKDAHMSGSSLKLLERLGNHHTPAGVGNKAVARHHILLCCRREKRRHAGLAVHHGLNGRNRRDVF